MPGIVLCCFSLVNNCKLLSLLKQHLHSIALLSIFECSALLAPHVNRSILTCKQRNSCIKCRAYRIRQIMRTLDKPVSYRSNRVVTRQRRRLLRAAFSAAFSTSIFTSEDSQGASLVPIAHRFFWQETNNKQTFKINDLF